MRKFLFILIALFAIQSVSAKQVSENEATKIASNFFKTNGGTNIPKSALKVSLAHEFKSENATLMYAFNNGYNGYVLVSGDDAVIPVLGYSDNGEFDYNTLPANARSWFDMYARMIKSIKEGKSKSVKTYSSATSVEPLIESKWDQGYPYWNYTPQVNGNQTYTGCAATAMAQIAYYHQWPVASTGEVDYVTESYKIPITAQLNTTFDWTNMTPTYDTNSSAASCNAVAELMREMGYAMSMDYSDEGSACGAPDIANAIVNHLGYDKGVRIYYADTYDEEEWAEMLKEELNASRPILYCGTTIEEEGHAFVCDGYNTDGLFHINWGWGGMSDGYFVITSLDPDSQGFGGAQSGAGFNMGQLAIMSIQKPVETSVAIPYTLVYFGGMMDVTETTVDLTLQELGNGGWDDFEGALCCDIVDEDMSSVKQFVVNPEFVCPVYQEQNISMSIPKELLMDLEDGTYAFYFYTVDSNEIVMELETPSNPFVFCKDGDEIISLFENEEESESMLIHQDGKIEIEDGIAYFYAVIVNASEDEDYVYTGPINFAIYTIDDELVTLFSTQELSIPAGNAIVLNFGFSVSGLPDGEYYIDMKCADGTLIGESKAPEMHFTIGETTSINGVDADGSNRVVNVVAIDGRIVKQNVKANEASQGLAPGIYFVGNKKIVVK